MNEKSLAPTGWDCVYRIVWIPKYRRKVLHQESGREVGGVIWGLVEKKTGCEIVEGGVCIDRVRVCLRIPPKCAVSDVMGCLKRKSALALCDRHPEWRSRIGRDRTFWARGYYVSTVGLNEAAVRKYIADQEDGSRFER
ncbi:MAG TPA: IS200/IS605 family transposase [Candidatus Rubneribacter avistercoris]|nr:IS200/IS605 family transposase [Candidatus Rubneribacter avistercoris]